MLARVSMLALIALVPAGAALPMGLDASRDDGGQALLPCEPGPLLQPEYPFVSPWVYDCIPFIFCEPILIQGSENFPYVRYAIRWECIPLP